MKSYLYHLQININFKNVDFYKNLMEFMGWKVIFETTDAVGYKSQTNGDLWFVQADNLEQTNYDAIGVNHISLRATSMSDVDAVNEYLNQNDIRTLFDTPKHRPEFTSSKNETYYQIMFETPDKILFEIVYIGAKD
ncbi:MAG: VOC family protein [bacterium]|nr:VOC family protein [bacterium]